MPSPFSNEKIDMLLMRKDLARIPEAMYIDIERRQKQRRIEFFNSMPEVRSTVRSTDMHKN